MDLYIINLVQNLRAPIWNAAMLFFTYLGDWPAVVSGILLICVLLAAAGRWRHIAAVFISTGGGEVFVWLLKHIVKRPRPFFPGALLSESDFSFPSGHAFISVAFYGLAAYFSVRAVRNRLWKTIIIIAEAVLAFIIGLSRVYLGVHWPTDVLAGWIFGAVWLMAVIAGLKIYERKKRL